MGTPVLTIITSIAFLVVLAVILAICIKASSNPVSETMIQPYTSSIPGKSIWLLWLSGWDNAPYVAQQVRKSWELLNPGWHVQLVSMSNLHTFISIPSYFNRVAGDAAKSDVIKLHLLNAHGGVWADATTLCMIPLDRWIYPALQPEGVWMYHCRDYGKGHASWFIISLRGSDIVRKWVASTDFFWSTSLAAGGVDSFFTDGLFMDLYVTDVAFARTWDNVPYLWCESFGQSHMLDGRCYEETPELIRILQHNPPYVVKLAHHGWDQHATATCNAMMAVKFALTQQGAPYPLHNMMVPLHHGVKFRDSVMVSADCAAPPEYIEEIKSFCDEHGNVQLILYDKCGFCKNVPNGVYCRPLANVGREGGAFLYFVATYYESLPLHIAFLPSNIRKHDRMSRMRKMYKDNTHGCSRPWFNIPYDFTFDEYEGQMLHPEHVRPYGKWYEKYIGSWDSHPENVCVNGLMRTTRDRILQRPRQFYTNLLDAVDNDTDPSELPHFLERSLFTIFHGPA